MRASALSLVQRSTSVYFAEHKFDRCQTCFCLIRAASVPLLNVLAVNLCSRLVSTGQTRMSVVLCSSDVFAAQKLASRSVHGCTFLNMPAGVFCTFLVSTGRTRMSVVLCSSDVFAAQKLASRSVHGCTLLDRLFAKG